MKKADGTGKDKFFEWKNPEYRNCSIYFLFC